jgi:hypothetical protein
MRPLLILSIIIKRGTFGKRIMLRVIFFSAILLLNGCATQHDEGIPSNSFPRHKLNFLFNEGLVLDYSDLDADDWRAISQDVQGRYAITEFVPKKESEANWKQKFIVAFYPKITMPKQDDLEDVKLFIQQSTSWPCLKEATDQIHMQTAEELIISKQASSCDNQGNEMNEVIRLVKTDNGIHQLSYLERDLHLDPSRLEQYIGYIQQAQVIKRKQTQKQ